ncbi:MAG: Orotidine 5'-phosphate decarboxylase [Candidatus Methanoperedenaceae archaeon GB50]|nr:MAG: Orotidine 5'-phosphate decarboxylase [Candidatus Methanoperedenaceae archaeon GB50]CAD7776626.1 Orotidine 5'-phosphate decarboxylase [Candidatus Methanoperedenaceae archaeon GB50]CAD7777864.1 Orotidine 5'-phosphate decarboxylase [Candidatus Methanoperedenaceae archaeon GB37]HEC49764.1 orotidine-5'-phosphate decarboxylase [Candidatus Desulfofervidus auxilii]
MKENIYDVAKNKLIFALDVPDLNTAKKWLRLLSTKVGCFKIGLQLFLEAGTQVIKIVKETTGNKVFLDLKLHDIPSTVLAACHQLQKYQVDFLSVFPPCYPHLFSEFQTGPTKIIGVTVLTYLDTPSLFALGIKEEFAYNPIKLVLRRAQLAKEAGCKGIVCSGQEVKQVKNLLGQEFIAITPGIRLKGNQAYDQKRITTPYEAIKNGSDYLVVGRIIRLAPKPEQVIERILEEISLALRPNQV